MTIQSPPPESVPLSQLLREIARKISFGANGAWNKNSSWVPRIEIDREKQRIIATRLGEKLYDMPHSPELEPAMAELCAFTSDLARIRGFVEDCIDAIELATKIATKDGNQIASELCRLRSGLEHAVNASDWIETERGDVAAIDSLQKAMERIEPSALALDAMPAKTIPSGRTGESVNDRMRAIVAANPEAADWTVEQFMQATGCKSKATVANTAQWRSLMLVRKGQKLERMERDANLTVRQTRRANKRR